VNLTVLPQLTGTQNSTVCYGGSIVVNGTTYDASNLSGTEVFTNIGTNNCDSTVTVTLTVLPELTGTQNSTVCYGGSIVVNGTTYDASNLSGTEVFTNIGTNNCDSTVTVNLTVLPELTGIQNSTVCFGGSIVVNGTTYNASNLSGTEVFTNIGTNNCDSTVTVNLTVLPELTGVQNSTVCFGGSIVVNGTTYDASNLSGTEVFTNIGTNNCDSTVTVTLTVLPELTGTYTETVCYGGSIVVNGTTYDASNLSGTEVFTNIGANNCDSSVTVTLTIEAEIDVTVSNVATTLTANQAGATYQWLDCDNGNAEISNETNQSYTATVNGNYAVVVTVGNCIDTSACQNIANVGINEFTLSETSVYPNPTTGMITIDFGTSTSLNSQMKQVTILSANGKLIYQLKNVTVGKLVVSLADYSTGVYFVRIQDENQVITKRLIKK
jgi:hypothetical protein